MKKTRTLLLVIMLIFTLLACSRDTTYLSSDIDIAQPAASSEVINETIGTDQQTITATAATSTIKYDSEDLEPVVNNADITTITLDDSVINVEGEEATVNGSSITITNSGTYQISGTLNDGQIIVDTTNAENVTLILVGVNTTSLSSAPIYVANAEKVILNLAEGSENIVTDGVTYLALDESGEPNATIFSKDDLTINGEGSLTVNANYNNGIASKDDLKITGGTIIVNAVNDGIKGRDSLAVKDGLISVNSGADGLQANNDEDPEEGNVAIEGGNLKINTGLDGIQAETSLLVSGGKLNITTGGGSVASSSGGFGGRGMEGNANQTEESVKGLKAGSDLTISGGEITISALDDALHSNNSLTIDGGNLELASGDDGIHADSALTIKGGTLNVTESYEGLESQVITINDGTIHLFTSDDGINATSGGGDMGGGLRGGMDNFGASDNYVYIHGGYLYMDANGDGLDSNGNFEMTNGVVLVNGPTNNGNGPLDYMSSFKISGGFLVAVGSAGMVQAPIDDSTQYAVLQILDNMQAAGTMIHIETAAGENVLTFLLTKEYQSILISSSVLQNGESYTLFIGGSSSGTPVDGLYTDGTYTPGTQAANFTITSIITGGGGGMFPGGGPGGRRPGGGGVPAGPPPPQP
jgi:hypothetical protein